MKIGDVVKAHVQVKSNAGQSIVGKLSYRACGPFIILQDLGGGSFEVQRYGDPTATTKTYNNADLYLLIPVSFPFEVLDNIDHGYLDCNHAPIVSPLLKHMQRELYNDTWLEHCQATIKTTFNIVDLLLTEADAFAFHPHPVPSMPSVAALHEEDNLTPHDTEAALEIETVTPVSTLHLKIKCSFDKLLFVQYTPAGTMKRQWYLVQIDLDVLLYVKHIFVISHTTVNF